MLYTDDSAGTCGNYRYTKIPIYFWLIMNDKALKACLK